MMRVLVLRPEPGASATVERARKRGLDAVAMPLFEIEAVEWDSPDPGSFDGLLVTSANAIRQGSEQLCALSGLPVYAVGAATADAAREVGFDVASVGHSDVDRLLRSLDPDLKLLHLCGANRKAPSAPRQKITPLVVYRAKERQADVGEVGGVVALVHSPRAAERFAELVTDRRRIVIAAISAGAATAAGGGWAAVEVADSPTDDALLALAAGLCNKPVGE